MQTRVGRVRHKTSMGEVAVALSASSATVRSLFCAAGGSVTSNFSHGLTRPKGHKRSGTQWPRWLPCSRNLFNIQVAPSLPEQAYFTTQIRYL
jgi:hypothetical protein